MIKQHIICNVGYQSKTDIQDFDEARLHHELMTYRNGPHIRYGGIRYMWD